MIYDLSGAQIDSAYVLNGNHALEAFNLQGSKIHGNETTLRVMTYNVGAWYTGITTPIPTAQKAKYSALQNGIFTRANADICLMQEYLKDFCQDGTLASDFLEPYFNSIDTTNETQGYRGHAICAKGYAVSNYQTHLFSNAGNTNYQGYETATINVNGKTINLINTHNNWQTAPQAIHMAEVLEAIKGMEYFILCGDFNIDMQTEDKTDAQYIQSVKVLLDRGYNMANFNDERGWMKTYYGAAEATGGKFCDNIITSSNIEVISAYADEAKLTDDIADKIDHLPIIATLAIR